MHPKLFIYTILALGIPVTAVAQSYEHAGTLTLPDQRWAEGDPAPTLTVSLRSLGLVMEAPDSIVWNAFFTRSDHFFFAQNHGESVTWESSRAPLHYTILGEDQQANTKDLVRAGWDALANNQSSYGVNLTTYKRDNDIMLEMRYWGRWRFNSSVPSFHPATDFGNITIEYRCNELSCPVTRKTYLVRIGALDMVPQAQTCLLSTNALHFNLEAQIERVEEATEGNSVAGPGARGEAPLTIDSCTPGLQWAYLTIGGCSPDSSTIWAGGCGIGGTARGVDVRFSLERANGYNIAVPIGRAVTLYRRDLSDVRVLRAFLIRNSDPPSPGTLDGTLWLQFDYP